MRTIVVAAAVAERNGLFLVTRRPAGVHLSGRWEFPGGKCEPGEALEACLQREMREELSVDVRIRAEIFATTHDYDDRRVELHFLQCELLGDPNPQLGQSMRWVAPGDLDALEFPPADGQLIALLKQQK
jgi:mutator protein MutT